MITRCIEEVKEDRRAKCLKEKTICKVLANSNQIGNLVNTQAKKMQILSRGICQGEKYQIATAIKQESNVIENLLSIKRLMKGNQTISDVKQPRQIKQQT